ncbi:unnamed protein product [Phytomonas sp. EM1]|nr:unnamed protein product [Phytomonas sp. EM1]|eukprot:CCW64716.1 unnamed protein product [Phytomonas sp. isolate EM1]
MKSDGDANDRSDGEPCHHSFCLKFFSQQENSFARISFVCCCCGGGVVLRKNKIKS